MEGKIMPMYTWRRFKSYLTKDSNVSNKDGSNKKVYIFINEIKVRENLNYF